MTTALDATSGPNTTGKNLISAFSASHASYSVLELMAMDKPNSIIKALDNGVLNFVNCTMLRRDFRVLLDSLCLDFSWNFMNSVYPFTILSILLLTMSCCMCAQIRCPRLEEPEAKPKKKKDQGKEYSDAEHAQSHPTPFTPPNYYQITTCICI